MHDESEKGPIRKAIDRAQDAIGAAVGQASAAGAANDAAAFVNAASTGDLFIIEAAQLGLDRGTSEDVRALASTLIDDHQRGFEHLRTKARSAGVSDAIATSLDERRRGMIDNLRDAGSDFDAVFLRQQAAAHQEAYTLHQGFAERGDEPGLRGLADATAPKLAQHISIINRLQAP